MRILHVIPYDASKPGGVQTHAFALSAWLAERGHESVAAAPASGPIPHGLAHADLGRPLRLRIGGTAADFALSPASLLRLRALIRSRPWDVIHVQEPLLPALGPAALRLAPPDAAVVATIHSAEDAAARVYAAAPLTRRLLRRADALIAASRVSLDRARPGLPAPVRIIPPAIHRLPPAAIRRDPEAILFLGRDEPRKGLAVLLEAAAGLPPGVRLIVAGPASDRSRARAARPGLAGKVEFTGPVDAPAARRLMAAAAVFCSPALGGEALGLSLIEAMACGTPVAASNIPGYRVASRNGRAAMLVPPGDPPALAAALQRLLRDRHLRDRLAAAGAAAARRHELRRVGLEHERLYRRMLRRR